MQTQIYSVGNPLRSSTPQISFETHIHTMQPPLKTTISIAMAETMASIPQRWNRMPRGQRVEMSLGGIQAPRAISEGQAV